VKIGGQYPGVSSSIYIKQAEISGVTPPIDLLDVAGGCHDFPAIKEWCF
jgi:hypothetical protein